MRTCPLALTLTAALLPLPSALAAPEKPPDPAPLDPSEPDVVGGTEAPPGKWNDTAAVLFDGQAACTGTLIAPDVVLTAGHCIGGITSVVLGSTDWAQPGGEEIAVVQEIEYPGSFSSYDVGLLLLERPSSYEPRVLATGCVLERSLQAGAAVTIVGYGAIDQFGNQFTSRLMEADTTITDPDCTGGRGCNGSVSPGGELGAGGGGIDSCFGDSGGPLYLLDPSGAYLVGATSRGYSDSQVPCSEGGIYVRPDAVIDWIEETSGRTLPRATCNSAPEPTAEVTTLEVTAGEIVSTSIQPNDPDAADTHTFRLGTAPMHGDVATDEDGTVHYRAHEDYEGPDTFTVVVTDSGVPAMEGVVTFQVMVLPSEGGCGCRAGGSAGTGVTLLLGLLALAPFARRRRR